MSKAREKEVRDFVEQCAEIAPLSVADQLRAKRTAIIREADRKRKILDRVIAKLEATEAESVMSEAAEVLADV